jgi:hypothetical protein
VKKVGLIWGYDEEGEVQGCWGKSGREGLWFCMGAYTLALWEKRILGLMARWIANLAGARFHSTHLAIRKFS